MLEQNAQDSVKEQVGFALLADFPARLRHVRKERRLNQTEFAALGAVSLNSQGKYETGATEPSASYLAHLANAEIDVMYLLTGRRSRDSLDATTLAVVEAARNLKPEQATALLAFLATL